MKHRIPPQKLDKWIRIGHGDPNSKLLCSRVPRYPKFAKNLLMLDLDMLLGSLNLSDKFNHVLMLSYSCIKSILYKLWC
jgi:hypothetical protein